MVQYVDDYSSKLPAANLHFVACYKSSDRLHDYSSFDCWVKGTIYERPLRTRAELCHLGSCYIVDVNCVPPLIHSELSVTVLVS